MKQLEDIRNEKPYNIPLETIQNLYISLFQEGYKLWDSKCCLSSVLIKKFVSFTTLSIILFIPYMMEVPNSTVSGWIDKVS